MSTPSKPYVTLTLPQVDRADELAYKARGIVACIRIASNANDELPDDAIPGACWAVEDMMTELCALAHGKPIRRRK